MEKSHLGVSSFHSLIIVALAQPVREPQGDSPQELVFGTKSKAENGSGTWG